MPSILSRGTRWCGCAIILTVICALLWPGLAGAQSGAVVKILPAKSPILVGETVTVNVRVENLSKKLRYVEINLKYDKNALQLVSVTSPDSSSQVFVIQDGTLIIQTTPPGELYYEAGYEVGAQGSGNSGPIFTIEFKGLQDGEGVIEPVSDSSVYLELEGGGGLNPTVENGLVKVQTSVEPATDTPTPTPSHTPTITPSPSPTSSSPTPTSSPPTPTSSSPTPSHTPTPSLTPTTASPTPSPTPTSPSPTPASPSPTPASPSPTPTVATPTPPSPTPTGGTPSPQAGLAMRGYARDAATGAGLANVKIYRRFASYAGVLIATTDATGYYQADFVSIPGDEMVTVWAELPDYVFTPQQYYWRHYYGYESVTPNFAANAPQPGPLTPTFTPTAQAVTTSDLGVHVVRQGETLYCLGRAYLVSPWAIAKRNNLYSANVLRAGQSLIIPADKWEHFPAGLICVRQFALPTPPPSSGGGTPTPTPAAPPSSSCSATYKVVYGNTLWSIARRYGKSPWAIAAANQISNPDMIFTGDVLCIP